MLSPEVRARLSKLTRSKAPPGLNGPATGRPSPVRWQATDRAAASPPCALDNGREVTNRCGTHWIIQESLVNLWPKCAATIEKYQPRLDHFRSSHTVHPDLAALARHFPSATAFLDIESCGLGSAMVFLVGVVHTAGDQLVLTQLWARSYAEESAMLESLHYLLRTRSVLVTFNGKSFDWPVLRDRTTMHMREDTDGIAELQHVDLLHHSRRRWKNELPNCKLQTLERYLCGRQRTGDIPGHEIPEVYQEYVRGGDETEVRNVLHHNALDLITLLQLSLQILE